MQARVVSGNLLPSNGDCPGRLESPPGSAPVFAHEDVDNRGNRVTKRFLKEDAGYEKAAISSVVAIEPDSKWRVIAEISGLGPNRKEVIVDDRDGNVVSYKQA
jgi:hypothetical protein